MSQISVFSRVFPIQSYFDDVALHTALKQQAMNELIVEKAVEPHLVARYIGLHPASQTPVAARLLTTKKSTGTTPIFLSPGQYIQVEAMQGLEWGLPAGWQGGGVATLVVGDGPEAFAGWTSQKVEVLLHRVRLPIVADGAPAGLTFRRAWPARFPWPRAQASVAVSPEFTRITMRLRESALAAQADMRVLLKGNDDLDIGSNGTTVGTTDVSYFDVTWAPAIVGIAAVAFPVIELSPMKLGGDVATVALVDISGAGAGGPLVGEFVDIMKYGRI